MPSKIRLLFLSSLALIFYLGFDAVKTCRQVGLTRKNGVGCVCHNEFHSPNVNVTLTGPDAVAIGETVQYSLAVFGGPDSAAGMNVAVLRGALFPLDTFLVVIDSELTCTTPLHPSENGVIRWNFSYTAPLIPGADTLYSVANSVNLNGIPTEDEWNFGENFVLTVFAPNIVSEDQAISHSFRLLSTYPNPFNASTNIRFHQNEAAFLSLRVFDLCGKEIVALFENKWMNAGNYTFEFQGTNFSSGLYMIQLQTPSAFQHTKILLLK
jgi:hypothetical protein